MTAEERKANKKEAADAKKHPAPEVVEEEETEQVEEEAPVATPEVDVQDDLSPEPPAKGKNKVAHVYEIKGGEEVFVRTYSLEDHGKSYAAKADEFTAKLKVSGRNAFVK